MFKYLLPFILLICECIAGNIIFCTETDPCHDDEISCPLTEDCSIHCIGDYSCSSSIITCPESSSATCSIECNGISSCQRVQIHAENALSFNMISNGKHVLSDSEIYCPSNTDDINSCNITYNGLDDGLDNLNVYTIHNKKAFTMQLQCSNNCWSSASNPVLHYDTNYQQQCTIIDSSTCQDIIVASYSDITTTASKSVTSSTTQSNINDNEFATQQEIPNASSHETTDHHHVLLIVTGMLFGIILSIFVLIIYLSYRYWKLHRSKPRAGKQTVTRSPSFVGKMKLSPSLKRLSPRLPTTITDFADVNHVRDSMAVFHSGSIPNTKISTEYVVPQQEGSNNGKNDGIVVTVQQYANVDNIGDEFIFNVNSPSSTDYNPPRDIHNVDNVQHEIAMMPTIHLNDIESIKSVSYNMMDLDEVCSDDPVISDQERITDGILPDEFVIPGFDDDDDEVTKY